MAASVASRRYVSAVYEDKYFPEKNAAIPFEWEISPGKPIKYDGDDQDEDDDRDYECNRSYSSNIQKDNHQCLQELLVHPSHAPGHGRATSIYPLRPPPKVSPASPRSLPVKDHLLHAGLVCHDHAVSDDPFDDGYHCPVQAYHGHGSFSRLSIRFRSPKASTVVPICKSRCLMKQQDKSQASLLIASHDAPALPGRSQSFHHTAMHGASAAAKQPTNRTISDVVGGDASMHVLQRRCNSFNSNSSVHHSAAIRCESKLQSVDDDDDDDDTSSMAAAAVWASACMLAAAAVHDAVYTDHHHHGSCRVEAMKLRDLMQQTTNFSELELPRMMKLTKGAGNMVKENLAHLARCHATITPAAADGKKEEEAAAAAAEAEAFLRVGVGKSCNHDDDDDDPKQEKKGIQVEGDNQPRISQQLVKRRSFLKALKNECITCWCPSPTF